VLRGFVFALSRTAHRRRPTAACLAGGALALGGSNGAVVLLDAAGGGFSELADLRSTLAWRVAGAVVSALAPAWAHAPAVTALASATLPGGSPALLALEEGGTLRAWALADDVATRPRPLLAAALPLPPGTADAHVTASLVVDADVAGGVLLAAVHAHPPGRPAAGRLLAYAMRCTGSGASAQLGAPELAGQLHGGSGPPPCDAAAAAGDFWALWRGGGNRGPPRLLRWRLAAAAELPASAALREDALASLAAAWADPCAAQSPGGAAFAPLSPEMADDCAAGDARGAAAMLRAHGGAQLAPGGPLEARLVAQLARRGVLSRPALAAALAAAGVAPHVVAAAGASAPRLLAAAAEAVRANAASSVVSSSNVADAAAAATDAVASSFAAFVALYAQRWRLAHPPLGLLRGGSGASSSAPLAGLIRAGASSLLAASPPRPGLGAGGDAEALLGVASGLSAALGGASCDALDELALCGAWTPGGPLRAAVALLRCGPPAGHGSAAGGVGGGAGDAARQRLAARRAAARLRSARLCAQLRALRDPAAAAEAALAALERAGCDTGAASAATTSAPPTLLGSSAAAAAVAADAARQAAAAALASARGAQLLLALVAEGRAQCGVCPSAAAALAALRPRADAAAAAALLAHWAAAEPALGPDDGISVSGGSRLGDAAAAVAPPPTVASAVLFAPFRASGGADALPSPLSAALAAAGARLAAHGRAGGASAAHAAAPPPPLAARAADLGTGLYFAKQLPALAALLRTAEAAAQADACASCSRPSLLFLQALVQCGVLAAASRAGDARAASAALDAACALFFRAGAGVDAGDVQLRSLLAALCAELGAAADGGDPLPGDDPAAAAAPGGGGPGGRLRYCAALMLCFERLGAPEGAMRFALAAVRVAPLAHAGPETDGAGSVGTMTVRRAAPLGSASARSDAWLALLWSNCCAYSSRRRRWRDAYTSLLCVPGGAGNDAKRASLARGLVAAACDAGDGGALLQLPWAGALAAAADEALSGRAAHEAPPLISTAAAPGPPSAAALLFALRTARGDAQGAAAAALAAARRLASLGDGDTSALAARCAALLRAANALRLAPPDRRFVVEHLPDWDPSSWPDGVGAVPQAPQTPAQSVALALSSPDEADAAIQLGYADGDDDGDAERFAMLCLGSEAQPAAPGAAPASGAQAWRVLAQARRPVRLATLADVQAEYALLRARLELPPQLAAAVPRGCCDAAADAALDALAACARFGPAAALATAWHGRAPGGAARAQAMARVAAALAARAVALERGTALQLPPPPPDAALGDALGRVGDDADAGDVTAEAHWAALRRFIAAHDAACGHALRYAAADAALAAAPAAALPTWLAAAFCARPGGGAGGGMARRSGADPAALLRLYLRHGALADAASLATDEVAAWATRAPATERAAPAAAWMAYGAIEATLAALRAGGEAARADSLAAAVARHADGAERDAATLRQIAASRDA